jgi:hypothetical protein
MITIDMIYKKIKETKFKVYTDVVQFSTAFGFNNDLNLDQTANLERSLMRFIYNNFSNKTKG